MQLETGTICWFEFPVTDFDRAQGFYGELFGWRFIPMQENYAMIQIQDKVVGGLRKVASISVQEQNPLMYFVVPELDSAVARAKALGAQLVGSKVTIGGDEGVYHWIKDRDQNLISLWATK